MKPRAAIRMAIALLWPLGAGATDISLDAAVRFNTVCARCHEGECSGRLSFNLDEGAATNHLRRYLGEVSPTQRREFQALLAYMKRECAHYPLPVAVPSDRRWNAEALAPLRSGADNAYFVPLGELAPGRYRALLRFAGEAEACAQTVSASFDIEEHPGIRSRDGAAEFAFLVERRSTHYLRLQAATPAVLLGLEIAPTDALPGSQESLRGGASPRR